MTMRKKLALAKEMPAIRGVEEDTFFLKETMCRTQTTFKQEAIARVRADEAFTSAAVVGVYLTPEQLKSQEKWERILLSLEGLAIPQ